MEYRAVGTSENPWTGESSSHEIYSENNDEEILPVADLFSTDKPILHGVSITTKSQLTRGQSKIESVAIMVYEPQSDTFQTACELMEIFWELGYVDAHLLYEDH